MKIYKNKGSQLSEAQIRQKDSGCKIGMGKDAESAWEIMVVKSIIQQRDTWLEKSAEDGIFLV